MGPQVESVDFAEHDCFPCEQQNKCISMDEYETQETANSNLLKEFELRRKEQGPIRSRNKWAALIFGQFVTLVATSMNSSSYVLEYGMHRIFPMFLLFNSYVVLTMHLFWSVNKNEDQSLKSMAMSEEANENETQYYQLPFTSLKLRTPWYYYFFLSCLDIIPNYLTLLAMNKTSFTSATLLGSLTIPSTMIFCRLLLGKEYRLMHYVGVILCIVGGVVTIFTDKVTITSSDGAANHPHSYFGDILAILASFGYGVGDACAEFWSKHVDREEYLGMIGLFGAIATFTASFLFERNALLDLLMADIETILKTLGVITWYILSLVAYYVFASLFLVKSDATLLNLSLQTSNFWAVFFSIEVFREVPDLHFYISIFMVISGVFVYELYGNDETEQLKSPDNSIPDESTPLNNQDRYERPPHYSADIA